MERHLGNWPMSVADNERHAEKCEALGASTCPGVKHFRTLPINFCRIQRHTRDRRNHILCTACMERGCTVKDPKLYACEGCKLQFSRQKFGQRDLNNFQQQLLKKLHCVACKSVLRSSMLLSMDCHEGGRGWSANLAIGP